MKLVYALVQGRADSSQGLVVKVAATPEELLLLPLHFDCNYWSPPRIHKVPAELCDDVSGAALMRVIDQQTLSGDYRVLRIT
jgi:hypothetical protein